MNELSTHSLKRYLTDEPWLATDNHIQEDTGHWKKQRMGLRDSSSKPSARTHCQMIGVMRLAS